jgi:hypothetical protein
MRFNLTRKGIFAVAALAISFATAAIVPCPVQASPRAPLYINLSGQQIPTVFWGLRPDPRFASVLNRETVSLHRQATPPHSQSLVYREGCPKKILRNAAFPQISCNGYFMVSEYLPCGLACGGHSFKQFSSNGSFACSGYYYAGDTCNGCELLELACDPCA